MGCSGDCSSCSSNCDSRKQESLVLEQNEYSNVRKVIAVVSGKGGVGKSTVTALLASAFQARGKQTAVLDADVTGPSIPKAFGVRASVEQSAMGLIPPETRSGVRLMSVNLLLESEDTPVVWRGPVISGIIKQFWNEVAWGDVDYMFVDMPPGTGDVPLTVFQSLPIDGIVVVTTPQDLVTMIVKKAVNMAKLMNVPIIGIIENMSWFECPDCGKRHSIFGESKLDEVSKETGIEVLARLPVRPPTAALTDKGAIELAGDDDIAPAVEMIEKYFSKD